MSHFFENVSPILAYSAIPIRKQCLGFVSMNAKKGNKMTENKTENQDKKILKKKNLVKKKTTLYNLFLYHFNIINTTTTTAT